MSYLYLNFYDNLNQGSKSWDDFFTLSLTEQYDSIKRRIGRFAPSTIDNIEGCDMVLDGAFEEAKLETKRKILGSTNKRILCLTDRYKKHMDWFLAPPSKSIEINVGSTIFANGDKI